MSRRALVGWALFDWGMHPFFVLITTFVFAPFFASRLAPDPATGQALWSYASAAAGLVLAALAPLLGGVSDATGPKKPWIAGCALVVMATSTTLWWAAPGAPYAVPLALAAFAIGTVAAEISSVFAGAMMARLVPPALLGRLSGLGWAVGYAGGLAALVLVLGWLAADPLTGRTYLGLRPLFGLDPASGEGARASGPLAAIWLLVFALPLLIWTPDAGPSGVPLRAALAASLSRLAGTVAEARGRPALARFLVANMIYQDGLVALFVLGGIYGAGLFGWSTPTLGLFGIMLTVAAAIGATVGAVLHGRVGALAIVRAALAVLIVVCIGLVSLGRDTVLFVVAVAPPDPASGPFASVSERLFLVLGLLIGLVAGPLQASARAHLAASVSRDEAARWFGLFALSGKVTSFLGPLCVALATTLTGMQAAGPAVLIAFFVAGLAILPRARATRVPLRPDSL